MNDEHKLGIEKLIVDAVVRIDLNMVVLEARMAFQKMDYEIVVLWDEHKNGGVQHPVEVGFQGDPAADVVVKSIRERIMHLHVVQLESLPLGFWYGMQVVKSHFYITASNDTTLVGGPHSAGYVIYGRSA